MQQSREKPHVVVAVIDSGINPYHEVFRKPNLTARPSTYIPRFPQNVSAINLTFGNNYDNNLQNDSQVWAGIKRETLYWIPGTNVIGAISFGETWHLYGSGGAMYNDDGTPILDEDNHGTMVASAITQFCPNVSLVVIEAGADTFEAAMRWAVNQPWIDILSSSKGWNEFPGLPYYPWKNISKITKEGCGFGKMIVNAGGNRIAPPWATYEAGPPWVISIGGVNNNTKGETVLAAKGDDFVADFCLNCAVYKSVNSYELGAGTSVSAPAAAGVLSSILFNIRKDLNYTNGIENGMLINASNVKISNSNIRGAVNKTAVYWTPLQYNPAADPLPSDIASLVIYATSINVSVVQPFIQMGWGYIGPEIVNDTVDILLGKKQYEPSLEKQIAEPYMNAIYEIRKTTWENLPE